MRRDHREGRPPDPARGRRRPQLPADLTSSRDIEGLRDWYAESADPELFRAVAEGRGAVHDVLAYDHVLENIDEAPVTTPYVGHEGLRQWVRDTREAVDDAWLELLELEEAGPGVYIATIRLHGLIGGIEADFVWYTVHRLEGGRVKHSKGYLSKDDALAAA